MGIIQTLKGMKNTCMADMAMTQYFRGVTFSVDGKVLDDCQAMTFIGENESRMAELSAINSDWRLLVECYKEFLAVGVREKEHEKIKMQEWADLGVEN